MFNFHELLTNLLTISVYPLYVYGLAPPTSYTGVPGHHGARSSVRSGQEQQSRVSTQRDASYHQDGRGRRWLRHQKQVCVRVGVCTCGCGCVWVWVCVCVGVGVIISILFDKQLCTYMTV